MNMNNADVRQYLKRGDITRIAKQLNVSNYTVYAELSGQRRTLKAAEIRKTAAEIISGRKALEKEASAALESALNT